MLYTKSEAATQFHVSEDTIERMVKRGELAATKIGACVRFSQDSIDQCIRRLTVCRTCGRDPKEIIGAELAAMGRQI